MRAGGVKPQPGYSLPPEYPHAPNASDEKLAALQKENEEVKKENALLKEAVKGK